MHLKKGRMIAFALLAAAAAAVISGTGAPFASNAAAAFFLAFLVSFLAVPFVRLLAYRINAMDVPRDDRRMHRHPIPRIGGLAIILGFAAGAFFPALMAGELQSILSGVTGSAFGEPEREMLQMLQSMMPGAVMIAALGLADDIRSLGPWPKLIVQTAAALVTVQGGTVIKSVSGIFGAGPYPLPGWFGLVLSMLWIIGVTNAVNLIDGLDGLACGVSAISSMAAAFIAGTVTRSCAVVLAASAAGACIGFLPYNLNPARIFMGDTGAIFLGYILAVISIQGLFRYPEKIPAAVPCLILGLPVFDTCFAVVRRTARGRSPLLPDRGHIHYRLVDRGFSQKQAAALLWAVSAALSVLAAALASAGG